jgi:hypothetical protein
MKFKPVMRYSPNERMLRLCRLIWERGIVGDGQGYSAMLSLALRPALFHVRKEWDGWRFTLLGVRLHFKRSWGGRLV